MKFHKALFRLNQGEAIQRRAWNGKGLYVEMEKDTPPSIHPFAVIKTNDLKYPWVPSQQDMLADDWQTINAWGDVCFDFDLVDPMEVENV